MTIVRIEDIRRNETAAVFIGRMHGANVSFFIVSCRRGEGPEAHRHRDRPQLRRTPGEQTSMLRG